MLHGLPCHSLVPNDSVDTKCCMPHVRPVTVLRRQPLTLPITHRAILAVGSRDVQMGRADTPVAPASIFSFAATMIATIVSWVSVTPDYGIYHKSDTSSWKIFIYTYLGFFLASLAGNAIGAAFAASAAHNPLWLAGLGDSGASIGGLISAILAPLKGFGRFLVVLVALSTPAASAPTMYSFGTSFMALSPVLAKIPRYCFALVSTAM